MSQVGRPDQGVTHIVFESRYRLEVMTPWALIKVSGIRVKSRRLQWCLISLPKAFSKPETGWLSKSRQAYVPDVCVDCRVPSPESDIHKTVVYPIKNIR